ncbi:Exo 5'-3' exonuclease (including N-terminal domain of PolI) [uncultured Caudovirales phage]|uniref:Exo 5'-3' exonuclease (Including N-terminal domain of PolI) n=1 Tax=uncultured Caudovirales phage TaxID=2100421 RepID=A0A6J5P0T0_9CAUD|nr:Exo 5'-3' exonuclease (including N-terminal domain of PolI) [uncultured Caudovirales phage]
MIIVDFSQVMLSNLMVQIGNHTNAKLEENMVRHMILNSLRSYKQKFGNEYGEIIIACDNTNYWRKQLFPYYKANRKKSQAASELDWKAIFECMNKIRAELKEFFPYKVLDIESAEADDIISTLVFNNTEETILILSGDKDFIQLHSNKNVVQYDPTRKKWVKNSDPERYLDEHILKGDSGDGVPNVLSSDNCFVVGERQKPLTQKKMDALIELGLDGKFDHPIFRNYWRNKSLIDLSLVPEEIKTKVMESFNSQANRGKEKLLNYFIQHKLKNLMENIGDF